MTFVFKQYNVMKKQVLHNYYLLNHDLRSLWLNQNEEKNSIWSFNFE
jgi:hypothetical protein